MAKTPSTCPVCGATLEAGAEVCPNGHRRAEHVRASRPSPDNGGSPSPAGAGRANVRPAENPFATELNRRLARMAQWSEASEPLGVDLPRLPSWAEEAASRSRNPEAWAEAVRGVERLAQRRIAEAFSRWEEQTGARIGRLEAYAVDSRLERSQVDDAVHAAKLGDVAQALATFQQVDRVVALKERHLDQARGELERLVSFLKDLEALGLIEAGEPAEVAAELERELRTGRLAALKQRLRLLHARAVAQLTEGLPEYVAHVGGRLAGDARSDPDVRELAVAAHQIVSGRPEDGVRRLRALVGGRGLGPERPLDGAGAASAP